MLSLLSGLRVEELSSIVKPCWYRMLTSTLRDVEEAGPVGTPMGSRPQGGPVAVSRSDGGEPVHVERRCRSARCAQRLFIVNDRELSGNVRLSPESQPLSPVVAQGKTGRVRPYRDLRVGNPLVAGSSAARPTGKYLVGGGTREPVAVTGSAHPGAWADRGPRGRSLANLRAPLLGLGESPSGKYGRMPTAALSPEPKFQLQRCARARGRPRACSLTSQSAIVEPWHRCELMTCWRLT
jgi:hypothetical protein